MDWWISTIRFSFIISVCVTSIMLLVQGSVVWTLPLISFGSVLAYRALPHFLAEKLRNKIG